MTLLLELIAPASSNTTLSPHLLAILKAIIVGCFAITVAFAAHAIFFRIVSRWRHKKDAPSSPVLHAIANRLRKPALLITLLTALAIASPILPLDDHILGLVWKGLGVAWFVALGLLMIAGIYLFEDILILRYDMTSKDNLQARRVRTQTMVLRRLGILLIIVITAGLILSLFKDSAIWHYGAGLLASAGLASLVLATAAKSTASNLLAGIQIALTEPFRLEDVVIVDSEWGRIEEITTTYVVVRTWDLRRLIVPLSYFIEKSFQNWTREHSDLLGTAFLYVDYTVPVAELRKEFFRLLEEQPQWDKKVKALQVTNISERTIEIRCLLSASNSGDAFDLRCIVREGMLDFIQKNYPESFPRTRFSSVGGGQSGGEQSPMEDAAREFAHQPEMAQLRR